jgi:hypothetical protein
VGGAGDDVGIASTVDLLASEHGDDRANQPLAGRTRADVAQGFCEAADARGGGADEACRLRQHVDHHRLADPVRVARGQHRGDRTAHRMADHRRLSELVGGDIAGDLLGDRGDDVAAGVAACRAAGEAPDLDQVIAVAGDGGDGAAPDVAGG